MKTFADKFNELFDMLGTAEMVTLYNEWASETGNEYLEYMENFNDVMQGYEPMDVALRIHFGSFDPTDGYFTFNGYGNLVSYENGAEYVDDYFSEMCDYYEDHESRLSQLCDEWDDLEDDEEEEEEEDEEEI